ncbi:MAG: serine hydrolase domain-containing protein [Pseudomonadota bacterium]
MSLTTTPAAPESAEPTLADQFERGRAGAPDFAFALGYARAEGPAAFLAGGPRHRGSNDEIGRNARWHIGSITKSFTATLIALMAEDGLLALDVPIGSYLERYRDEMDPAWQALTLRALLSHTAGLRPNPPRWRFFRAEGDNPSEDRRTLLREMWTAPPAGAPGAFAYSNTGYMLAGLVAEEVSGQSWQELLYERVLRPLALETAGFGPPTSALDPFGHRRFLGFTRPADPTQGRADNPAWIAPAGNLHMGFGDLLAWGQAHLRACGGADVPGLPGPAGCREMQIPVTSEYGLGWVVQTQTSGAPVIWHNGSNTMWHAILMLFPEQNLVVAAAANVFDAERVESAAIALGRALLEDAAAR